MNRLKNILSILVFQILISTNQLQALIDIIQGPDEIIMTHIDSYPSTYAGSAFRDQSDDEGGGSYIVFHAKDSELSNKRVYYSYINDSGNIINCATISTNDFEEGFPSLDIDYETGNPLVAWNNEDGIMISYDLYHLGSPGLWKTPFYIFDENTLSIHPDDFFQFPLVEIGNSPIADKRRVYVVAKNTRTPNIGEQYVNAMLAYADFNVIDFNMQSELNWEYVQLQFTNQIYTEAVNPYHFTFTSTNTGKLAIVGYTDEHDVFVLLNENYGEGNFQYYSELYEFPVENPLNLDETYRFTDDLGNPYELYFAASKSENTNATFTDNDTKIIFPVSFALMAEPGISFDNECLLYPKVINFNLFDQSISFSDFHYRGINPNDDNPMIPWDYNEDGNVDEYDEEGLVEWLNCWPIYYPEHGPIQNIDSYKISRDEQNGISIIVWSDGTKAKLASLGLSQYWQWEEVPEIAVSIRSDNSSLWSDTEYLNSNYFSELQDMIPAYIYPASQIIDSGNDFYQLDLMFFDDYIFGPSLPGLQPGPNGELNIIKTEFYYNPPQTYGFWIITPDGDEEWFIGQTYEIQWNPNGIAGLFTIQLMEDNQVITNIAEYVEPESFSWTIPNSIIPGNQYLIKIYSHQNACYDTSDYYFSILEFSNSDEIEVARTELFQNIPNPFNPSTEIRFNVPQTSSFATIEIYNLKGQKIRQYSIFNNQSSIVWDGTDQVGKPVSSGVYFAKLKAGNQTVTRKMLLMK
jgi:FlgD Ig-like domain/Kre9/KNH-like N-terminal Ig-like domain